MIQWYHILQEEKSCQSGIFISEIILVLCPIPLHICVENWFVSKHESKSLPACKQATTHCDPSKSLNGKTESDPFWDWCNIVLISMLFQSTTRNQLKIKQEYSMAKCQFDRNFGQLWHFCILVILSILVVLNLMIKICTDTNPVCVEVEINQIELA